jgi:hypothetical protein
MTLPPRLTTPLADWIASAAPGDRVIIQTAHHNGNGEVARARDDGLITTAQKRADAHSFHLIAFRTRGQAKPEKRPLSRAQARASRST